MRDEYSEDDDPEDGDELIYFSTGSDPQDFEPDCLDLALRQLLKLNLISVEWSDDLEEFVFYMTDEQKKQHDLAEGGE